jgi:hypothetical protein
MAAPAFKVRWAKNGSNVNHPKIDIDRNDLFYACKLAKEGYYGGNPEAILRAPADVVINLIRYEQFVKEVEAAYQELNQGAQP